MLLRLARTARASFILAIALAAIPACKKPKPPEPDTPAPSPRTLPGPPGGPGAHSADRDQSAPLGPNFSGNLEPVHRTATQSNLKQIMLALQEFSTTNGAFPAGYADKSGKPGLSWRVAILPYLDQKVLFDEFHLDEPWDSSHNRTLISKMPVLYAASRTSPAQGYTFYRGFTGPNTWLPPQTQPGQPGKPLFGIKPLAITDGMSNTILVAEAVESVIWTRPEDLEFAPNKVPKLGGVFASGFHVGMADGSVKFVRKGIDEKTISNAIQTNDGHPVKLDQ